MDAYGLDFWLNAVVILGLSILGIIGKYKQVLRIRGFLLSEG